VDNTGEIWRAYEVRGQPTFAFINDNSDTIKIYSGPLGVDGLSERLDELLAN
jgi:hypothetical protein